MEQPYQLCGRKVGHGLHGRTEEFDGQQDERDDGSQPGDAAAPPAFTGLGVES